MKKIIALFFIIGFLVYFQSLFNGFVWDDIEQLHTNSMLKGFQNIPNLFLYYWSSYYKPVFYIVLNIINTIFGANPFSFHLIQLLIHILNSILVFLIFTKFFKRNISFILSLIFLVHPVISETVFYVSAMQDVLFFFFGILALLIAIEDKLNKKIFIVFALLALSILSKETGIGILLIVLIYKLFFNREGVKKYLLISAILFPLYLILRFVIVGIRFWDPAFTYDFVLHVSLQSRLLTIPKIIFTYLSNFFYPDNLQIFRLWWVLKPEYANFYFPLLIILITSAIAIAFIFFLYKKSKQSFLLSIFFLSWFLIGIGMHLQIILLDMTMAERWFYLSIAGLLGFIGIFIQQVVNPRNLKFFYILASIIIILLSLRTFIRSFNWLDTRTLVNHDYNVDKKNLGTIMMFGDYYFDLKNYSKAEEIYKSGLSIDPTNDSLFKSLADSERQQGHLKEAKEFLLKSGLKSNTNKVIYSYILLTEDPQKAHEYLDKATKESSYGQLFLFLAIAEYKLGNTSKALKDIEKADDLSPFQNYDYYENLMIQGKPILLKK